MKTWGVNTLQIKGGYTGYTVVYEDDKGVNTLQIKGGYTSKIAHLPW